jgi:hypothetical protein
MSVKPRNLAPQRKVSLYQDQEERLLKLNQRTGGNFKYSKVVRLGVDSILKKLEKSSALNK